MLLIQMNTLPKRSEYGTKTTHLGDESFGVSLVARNSVYFHVILIAFLQLIPQVIADTRLTQDERGLRK